VNLDGGDAPSCIGGTDFHEFMSLFGRSCQ